MTSTTTPVIAENDRLASTPARSVEQAVRPNSSTAPAKPSRRVNRILAIAAMLVAPLALAGCQETTAEDRAEALSALNADRARGGLRPLTLDETLNAKADSWAIHLRDTCTLEHSNLTDDLGTLDWQSLGENVGYGATIQSIESAYMNSPAHKASIMSTTFTIVGIGVTHGQCNGKDRTYVVQVFASLF